MQQCQQRSTPDCSAAVGPPASCLRVRAAPLSLPSPSGTPPYGSISFFPLDLRARNALPPSFRLPTLLLSTLSLRFLVASVPCCLLSPLLMPGRVCSLASPLSASLLESRFTRRLFKSQPARAFIQDEDQVFKEVFVSVYGVHSLSLFLRQTVLHSCMPPCSSCFGLLVHTGNACCSLSLNTYKE
jgi:hypothetical protein